MPLPKPDESRVIAAAAESFAQSFHALLDRARAAVAEKRAGDMKGVITARAKHLRTHVDSLESVCNDVTQLGALLDLVSPPAETQSKGGVQSLPSRSLLPQPSWR